MKAMPADRCDLLCLDLERAEALREAAPAVAETEGLAALAKGLGDPTRVRLAMALREGGELCVCDLSWIVERAENLVSHHLRLMRTAGVARSRRDGKMVLYSLSERGLDLLGILAGVEAPR
jgi:DNA-binding transcriptional ArsR family regulator